MTHDNALRVFTELHNPTRFEKPINFDGEKACQHFQAFVQELERYLEAPCIAVCDVAGIQDASFFAEVVFPRGLFDDVVLLRFSTYGSMAAFRDDSELDSATLNDIADMLTRYGFVYIPCDVFSVRYHEERAEQLHHSWWYRYFDYL